MEREKRKKLEREIIKQLKEKGIYKRAYNTIVMIYASMLVHKEKLEEQLEQAFDIKHINLLNETLEKLNDDIEDYKVNLML